MSLGTTLSVLRKKAQITQSELGEKLHVSAQAVSKWENDISEPDISTLRKIANIYGVSVSDIMEETEPLTATEEACEAERTSAHPERCDVYLTDIGESKIIAIKYIRDMLGLGLAEAKAACESLPYLITGNEESETAERIAEYFSKVGATVKSEPATGQNDRRELFPANPLRLSCDMRKRFIVANVTAAIPGILVMIGLMLLWSSTALAVIENIYVGISVYTVIFLSWYPTLTRKLLSPIGKIVDFKGFFGFIGAIMLLMLFLPWFFIVTLISPVNYAFAIKMRVQRMLDGDVEDDVLGI